MRSRPSLGEHLVEFYEDDERLGVVVAKFLGAALRAGEPAVAIATAEHRAAFLARLRVEGIAADDAVTAGRLVLLDARETLESFLVDGVPDAERFARHVFEPVRRLIAEHGSGTLSAFGEMVDLLWRDGRLDAALRLEEMWNDLLSSHSFSLLCAYGISSFYKNPGGAARICAIHDHALPAAPAESDDADVVRALVAEVAQRKKAEGALRMAMRDLRAKERELAAKNAELRDFVENANVGLHWIGAKGKILWANQAELDLLGYAPEEYIGHDIAEFHVDPETIQSILERLQRNENVHEQLARLKAKDGSIREVLISSSTYRQNDSFTHTRCFTRDVTAQQCQVRRAEQTLRDLQETVRFSEMFTGILGHDLRNPLSAIMTATQLALLRAESEALFKPLSRILVSGNRMARMIDQLLDFTRVRVGKGIPIAVKPMELVPLLRHVMEELDDANPDWKFHLEYAGDVSGNWDGDRLAQVFSNLIANAVQHGEPEHGVRVHVDGADAARVVVEVRNMGQIPPSVLANVFEPMSGGDRHRDGSQGLGLGLYISREIVNSHGGTIEVLSTAEAGTVFVVRLPRASAG